MFWTDCVLCGNLLSWIYFTCQIWFDLGIIDRSAYCDAQLPPENLREFLPRLIPVCFIHGFLSVCFQNHMGIWVFCESIFFCISVIFPAPLFRFCCLTWFMLMTMSHFWRLRFGVWFIFRFQISTKYYVVNCFCLAKHYYVIAGGWISARSWSGFVAISFLFLLKKWAYFFGNSKIITLEIIVDRTSNLDFILHVFMVPRMVKTMYVVYL